MVERTEQLRVANSELRAQISERDGIQQALDGKNIERQEADQSKDRFLANMSQELRTALNGISSLVGCGQFLVDGKPGTLNAKQKEYVGHILNNGRHLLKLISDMPI